MSICKSCGTSLETGQRFCTGCGVEQGSGGKRCVGCNTPLAASHTFCPSCGKKVEGGQDALTIDTEPMASEEELFQKAKRHKREGIALSVFVIVMGAIFLFTNSQSKFREVYRAFCSPTWASLGEDGSYLSIDTNPSDIDDGGIVYDEAFDCLPDVHEALNLPDSLIEQMKKTKGTDGMQTEEFQRITVEWSYHPDRGLEVIYSRK